MIVQERKIGNSIVKIDDSQVCRDVKQILMNLERIASNGLAEQNRRKKESERVG